MPRYSVICREVTVLERIVYVDASSADEAQATAFWEGGEAGPATRTISTEREPVRESIPTISEPVTA